MFLTSSGLFLALFICIPLMINCGFRTENNSEDQEGTDIKTDDAHWDLYDEVPFKDFGPDHVNENGTSVEPAAAAAPRRFQVHSHGLPWFDAVAACWRRGHRLAAPREEAEAQLLGRVLAAAAATANATNVDTIDAMHVGFHDLGLEGKWYTTEGDSLTFGEWLDDAIFTRQGAWVHRCAAVIGDGRFIYQSTSQRLIYACDTQPPPRKPPAVDSTMVDGYSAVAGGRRFKLHASPLPWLAALEACEGEGEGAALAGPAGPGPSAAALQVLRAAAVPSGGAFVGFNDISAEGDWRDARGNYVPFGDNWESGEPNGGRSDNCVEMTQVGTFKDVPCSESKPFMCEKMVIEEEQPEYITVDRVGKYGLHKKYKSWMSALMKCRSDNGTLALPKSHREADALKKIVMDVLGESEKPKTHDYPDWRSEFIIGVHDMDGDGQWSTIDGVPLVNTGYNEWLRYNPTYHEGLMKCGGFSFGKYVHIECDSLRMYICQKPL